MSLKEILKGDKILLFDGAIGTELDKRGLMGRGRNNIDEPEAVVDILREYVRCGCDAITANTLTMNRIFIETHKVDVDVEKVNRAGVELAKEAAGDKCFVLGDISSTGQMLEPYGTYSESQFYENSKEQAAILGEAGVDGFIIETVFDLREALCALAACKENFSLPIIATIAFQTETNGGRTIMGNSATECAVQLAEAGADVVGANCGELDPVQMAEVISIIRAQVSVPVIAQPNAGKPKLVGDDTVFEMEPAPFAEGIIKCIEAGAKIVGGCCGTTPKHIKAVAGALRQ